MPTRRRTRALRSTCSPIRSRSSSRCAELRLRSADAGIDLVYVDAPLMASYASRGFLSPIDASHRHLGAWCRAALDAGKYDGDAVRAADQQLGARCCSTTRSCSQKAGITPPAGITAGQTADAGRCRHPRLDRALDLGTGGRCGAEADRQGRRPHHCTTASTVEQFAELYQLQPFGESLGTDVIAPDGVTATGYLDSEAWTKAATYLEQSLQQLGRQPEGPRLWRGRAAVQQRPARHVRRRHLEHSDPRAVRASISALRPTPISKAARC